MPFPCSTRTVAGRAPVAHLGAEPDEQAADDIGHPIDLHTGTEDRGRIQAQRTEDGDMLSHTTTLDGRSE